MENIKEVKFDKPKYNENGELIKKCGCFATKREIESFLRNVNEAIENIERMMVYNDYEDEVYTEEYFTKLAEHIAYNEIECDCESELRMMFIDSSCGECGKNIYITSAKFEEIDLQVDLWYNEDDVTIQKVKSVQVTRYWDEKTQQFYATRGIADVIREIEDENQEKLNMFDNYMDENLHKFVCYCIPPSEINERIEEEIEFNKVDEEFVKVRRIAKENNYECDFEGMLDEDDEDEDDDSDYDCV